MRDEIDLDAIEASAAAATPGPWEAGGPEGISQSWQRPEPWLSIVEMDGSDSWSGCNHRLRWRNPADEVFIVAAREDVPALCCEVRRLRAEVTRLRRDGRGA